MTEIRVLVYREKFRAEGFQRGRGRGHFLRAYSVVVLSLNSTLSLSLSLSFSSACLSSAIIKVENPNSEHDEKRCLHVFTFREKSHVLKRYYTTSLCPSALPHTSRTNTDKNAKRHERQRREKIAGGDAIHLHSRMARAIHEKQLHNGPKRDFHFRGKSARYAHA